MGDSVTGHRHTRWDDAGDENVHAVFKAFHSFKDGKISSITVQRKKETKMEHKMPAL